MLRRQIRLTTRLILGVLLVFTQLPLFTFAHEAQSPNFKLTTKAISPSGEKTTPQPAQNFKLKWGTAGESAQTATVPGLAFGSANFKLLGSYPAQLRAILNPGSPSPDTTPPTISNLTPPPNSTVNTSQPTISATYVDNPGGTGIDPASVLLIVDSQNVTGQSTVTLSSVTYVPSTPMADGPHSVTLSVSDLAGNPQLANWSFQINTATIYNNPILFQQNPINNPAIAGEAIRLLNDPTGNFMGDRSISRPGNLMGDLTPALSDDSLYQDTLGLVSLHNGNVLYTEVLHRVPGRGVDFAFIVTYSAKKNQVSGPLGLGWDHNYNARLAKDVGGNWVLSTGFQQDLTFAPAAGFTGFFYGPPGNYSVLKETPTQVIVRNRHGVVTTFERYVEGTTQKARLIETRDANDNTILFGYDAPGPTGKLVSVQDNFGRAYTLSYGPGNKLMALTDFVPGPFGPRNIQFSVVNDLLVSYKYPEVTGTSTGNDFAGANRKTKELTYLNDPNPLLDKKLQSIKNPNEVAQGLSGDPYVTVTYYQTPPRIGWVYKLTLGRTNYFTTLPFVPYETTYTYSLQNVTVTDRVGNVTTYTFDASAHLTQVNEPIPGGNAVTALQYNSHGEVTQVTNPLPSQLVLTYEPSPATRYNIGNVIQVDFQKDPGRPSDQTTITTTYAYEPIYSEVYRTTDPRSSVTNFDLDYFEQPGLTTLGNMLATEFLGQYTGTFIVNNILIPQSIPTGIGGGNINGDTQFQYNGNIIGVRHPDVTLPMIPASLLSCSTPPCPSPQAQRESDTIQKAGASYTYNQFGQLTSRVDEEENATFYAYYTAASPGSGTIGAGGGYLARVLEDTTYPHPFATLTQRNGGWFGDIGRNSGLNPTLTQIRADYEYNTAGVVTKLTNPRGAITLFEVNQLDQVVKITRAAGFDPNIGTRGGGYTDHLAGAQYSEPNLNQTLLYQTKFFFDYNNNVIARFMLNNNPDTLDSALAPSPAYVGTITIAGAVGWIEVYYYHDILDNLRKERMELDFSGSVSTLAEMFRAYDRNENLLLVTDPEGNQEAWTHDPRDLMLTHTRGAGSPFAAMVSYTYDANRNRIKFTDAADNDGNGVPEDTLYIIDGHERPKKTVNAVGTEIENTYDAASNITDIVVRGVSVPPAIADLKRTHISHNERDQAFRILEDLFLPTGTDLDPVRGWQPDLNSLFPNAVATFIDHSRLLQRTFVTEEDLNVEETRYNGDGQVIREVDPYCGAIACVGARQVDYFHDDNGNLVVMMEVDRPSTTALGVSEQTFRFLNDYDADDRVAVSIAYAQTGAAASDRNLATYHLYDSRGLLRFTADANHVNGAASSYTTTVGQVFPVNAPGNVVKHLYDVAGHRIKTEHYLTSTGFGDGTIPPANVVQTIVTRQGFSKNSLLISQTDGLGPSTGPIVCPPTGPISSHTTCYQYDALNRRTITTFADSTTETLTYDGDDNVLTRTDQNGTGFTNTYDGINRLLQVSAAYASGNPFNLIGSTQRQWQYNGLSLVIKAVDSRDALLGNGDDVVINRRYNSRLQLLEERQSIPPVSQKVISFHYVDEADRSALLYPKNFAAPDTSLSMNYVVYDSRDRLKTFSFLEPSNPPKTFTYEFLGDRALQRSSANGVVLRYHNGAGTTYFDSARRVTQLEHLGPFGPVAGFTSTHDRMHNRKTDDRIVYQPFYTTGLDLQHDFTYDSAYRLNNDAYALVNLFNLHSKQWAYNTANSRLTENINGPLVIPESKTYTSNAVNAYTQIQSSLPPNSQTFTHDANGNLTSESSAAAGLTEYFYDVFNLLRRIRKNGIVMAQHGYDPENRRVWMQCVNPPQPLFVFHDGQQAIAEYTTPDNLAKLWILRPGVLRPPLAVKDHLLAPLGIWLFFTEAVDGSVKAVTLDNGYPLVGFEYGEWGNIALWSIAASLFVPALGDPLPFVGNFPLFQGMPFEPATGLYYDILTSRFYSPSRAAYLQKYPLGMWAVQGHGGNPYMVYGLFEDEAPKSIDDLIEKANKDELRSLIEILKDLPGIEKDLFEWAEAALLGVGDLDLAKITVLEIIRRAKLNKVLAKALEVAYGNVGIPLRPRGGGGITDILDIINGFKVFRGVMDLRETAEYLDSLLQDPELAGLISRMLRKMTAISKKLETIQRSPAYKRSTAMKERVERVEHNLKNHVAPKAAKYFKKYTNTTKKKRFKALNERLDELGEELSSPLNE